MELSEQERQARRQRAIDLHRQGKFGGRQPGSGRPSKKKRASEIVAEEIQGMAAELLEAFKSGLDDRQPPAIRVNTAKEMLKIEMQAEEMKLKEDRALEGMTTDQLIEILAKRIGKIESAGELPSGVLVVLTLSEEEIEEQDE